MEIKIENVKAAFNTADESGKKLLLALFPELSSETAQKADKRPVLAQCHFFVTNDIPFRCYLYLIFSVSL